MSTLAFLSLMVLGGGGEAPTRQTKAFNICVIVATAKLTANGDNDPAANTHSWVRGYCYAKTENMTD